jgi:hypothetical protein
MSSISQGFFLVLCRLGTGFRRSRKQLRVGRSTGLSSRTCCAPCRLSDFRLRQPRLYSPVGQLVSNAKADIVMSVRPMPAIAYRTPKPFPSDQPNATSARRGLSNALVPTKVSLSPETGQITVPPVALPGTQDIEDKKSIRMPSRLRSPDR